MCKFRTQLSSILKISFSLSILILIGCSAAGKGIKRGDDAIIRGDYYTAANEYISVLKMKPQNSTAIAKLTNAAKKAFDQKLKMAEGYLEQKNLENSLLEYKELAEFLNQLKAFNALNFVPINIDQKIKEVSAGAAEEHYQNGESMFKQAQYEKAIEEYKTALNFNNPYKDIFEKIADSYYNIGINKEKLNLYRLAAENFWKSDDTMRGYKDAANRSANLYYNLGNYFMSIKQCRKAFQDFSLAKQIISQFKDINSKIDSAKDCAMIRIAFVNFDNATGKDLSGMALGDFIFDATKSKAQERATQFIRILDREQLLVLAQEQRISAGSFLNESPLPSKLEGVDYLIFGKLNQVYEKHDGLSKSPSSAEYDYWYNEPYIDSKGKKDYKTIYAKGTMYYNLYNDKLSVTIGGSIRVVEAKSGAVIINHQISEEKSDVIRYADNFSAPQDLSSSNVEYDKEIKRLASARRELESIDSIVKNMINSIASKATDKILSTIDVTPNLVDPAVLNYKNTADAK